MLNGLLFKFSNKILVTEEILTTLFCEVEDILNSKPLTVVSTDVEDLYTVTPNHLLKLRLNSLPVGKFENSDLNLRKRWRQI